MLARKKTSKVGKPLPIEWIESLNRLMNDSYKTECQQHGRYFDVYGQAFPDEFLLIVSYLSDKDDYSAPTTLFLSSDHDKFATEDKLRETQKSFIDLVGLFFDEIFSEEEWDLFEPNWQEVSHKNETYFYKISRENVNTTIEADRLLGDHFEDTEFDEDSQ